MTTNPYLNNFNATNEQTVLEDLIVESIAFYGQDMYYIPRVMENKDKIYGEDGTVNYQNGYAVEMYIKGFMGFTGDQNFFSKFGGLEIRDQMTFVVAKRRFDAVVGAADPTLVRPREGDLVYFPLNQKCFTIMFTNNKSLFYPLGSLPIYELTCELMEYSQEDFNTGIAEVDVFTDYNLDEMNDPTITVEDVDPSADNETIQAEANTILTFNPTDPYSQGNI